MLSAIMLRFVIKPRIPHVVISSSTLVSLCWLSLYWAPWLLVNFYQISSMIWKTNTAKRQRLQQTCNYCCFAVNYSFRMMHALHRSVFGLDSISHGSTFYNYSVQSSLTKSELINTFFFEAAANCVCHFLKRYLSVLWLFILNWSVFGFDFISHFHFL